MHRINVVRLFMEPRPIVSCDVIFHNRFNMLRTHQRKSTLLFQLAIFMAHELFIYPAFYIRTVEP